MDKHFVLLLMTKVCFSGKYFLWVKILLVEEKEIYSVSYCQNTSLTCEISLLD